jgi:glycosyltransferase involved in cell wall biosynthesis
MKPIALFLSNEIYFDASKKEGGVRICTEEFLALISKLYHVKVFKVAYHISICYRLQVKFGFNVYSDYQPKQYARLLAETIRKENVKVVFLNLSNTAPFATVIKTAFGDKIKVVLCSHGNESGDFLHEATRFKKNVPTYRRWLSGYTLGNMLKKEVQFRQQYLDAVLTVSPVEEALERWLGAKQVLMVPRTVSPQFIPRNPQVGRVGFIGDLSHAPNFYGIDEVCKAISSLPQQSAVNVRLVGAPALIGEALARKYSFVTYLGYMGNEELEAEAGSWTYFLNPVFYYSRGVSTKLAKAFGWGIPVITTTIGCRGYHWETGDPLYAETPNAMAEAIAKYSMAPALFLKADAEIQTLVSSMPDMGINASALATFLRGVI